jgi:hypothetical protein
MKTLLPHRPRVLLALAALALAGSALLAGCAAWRASGAAPSELATSMDGAARLAPPHPWRWPAATTKTASTRWRWMRSRLPCRPISYAEAYDVAG